MTTVDRRMMVCPVCQEGYVTLTLSVMDDGGGLIGAVQTSCGCHLTGEAQLELAEMTEAVGWQL